MLRVSFWRSSLPWLSRCRFCAGTRRSTRANDPMTVTIFHNPACGTSRNALAMIRNAGIEPDVIEYLKTPPSRDELTGLVARMGVPLRDVLRRKGTPFDELGLDDPALTDADLLDAVE